MQRLPTRFSELSFSTHLTLPVSNVPQEMIPMKRNTFQLLTSTFQRGLLPLAIVALALSLVSVSQLTPKARAQTGQKMSSAPAANDTSGSAGIVYPETKRGDTVDYYFGTKVADPYRWLEDDVSVS